MSLFSQSSGRVTHENKLGETGGSERAERKLGSGGRKRASLSLPASS